MFRKIVVVLTLVAALVGFCVGCSGPDASGGGAETEALAVPLVASETIESQTWQETLELTAELYPWASVVVAAETGGRYVGHGRARQHGIQVVGTADAGDYGIARIVQGEG